MEHHWLLVIHSFLFLTKNTEDIEKTILQEEHWFTSNLSLFFFFFLTTYKDVSVHSEARIYHLWWWASILFMNSNTRCDNSMCIWNNCFPNIVSVILGSFNHADVCLFVDVCLWCMYAFMISVVIFILGEGFLWNLAGRSRNRFWEWSGLYCGSRIFLATKDSSATKRRLKQHLTIQTRDIL